MSLLKSFLLSVCLMSSLQAQELFTELQAQVTADGPPFTFRVLGARDSDFFSAYGIHVIAPDGREQMLDQFDALLPQGSEADALYVEDVNFDGYADLRIMKYLPGGANVPYFFWIYDPATNTFQESKEFEVVLSPQVDQSSQELLSRQKLSATEYVTEYYKASGSVPVLIRKEERVYSPDGSSVLRIYQVQGDSALQLMETRNLDPEK